MPTDTDRIARLIADFTEKIAILSQALAIMTDDAPASEPGSPDEPRPPRTLIVELHGNGNGTAPERPPAPPPLRMEIQAPEPDPPGPRSRRGQLRAVQAARLAAFSTTEPRPLPAGDRRAFARFVVHGYLKKTRKGYLRTEKIYQ